MSDELWLWWHRAYDVIEVVVPLVMIPVVARLHRPHAALAWIVVIAILPVTGLLGHVYLAQYRVRRRRRRLRRVREVLERAPGFLHGDGEFARPAPPGSLVRLVESVGGPRPGGWPSLGGNRLELAEDRAFFEGLVRDIDAARDHVHLLYFLFNDDGTGRAVAEALVRARGRGVRCRLLAGAYSSHWQGSRSLFRELAPRLERHGVEVHSLRPLNPLRNGFARIDLRNHRKLAVVDGRRAWVGSHNVHDADLRLRSGRWRDLSVRVEGPGARQLQTVFAHDWQLETGEALPGDGLYPKPERAGDATVQTLWWGPTHEVPGFAPVLVAAFNDARERIVLSTPYFVPDEATHAALQVATLRGVRVDLIVPDRSDQRLADAAARAWLGELIEAGARVHRHGPGLLHAKSVSVDDRFAVVGSGNCDRRSFYLDYEASVLVHDEAFARAVRRAQEGWIAESRAVDPEAWRGRSRLRDALDHTAALASPLL